MLRVSMRVDLATQASLRWLAMPFSTACDGRKDAESVHRTFRR